MRAGASLRIFVARRIPVDSFNSRLITFANPKRYRQYKHSLILSTARRRRLILNILPASLHRKVKP